MTRGLMAVRKITQLLVLMGVGEKTLAQCVVALADQSLVKVNGAMTSACSAPAARYCAAVHGSTVRIEGNHAIGGA